MSFRTDSYAGRFECRWSTVRIEPSPAVMLAGMEGSNVGIWVAHGEGRCLFPDPDVELAVLEGGLAPLRYSDAQGRATETYPHNPNGSPHGIAALCSADGRHLAMMPHPERCATPHTCLPACVCWSITQIVSMNASDCLC